MSQLAGSGSRANSPQEFGKHTNTKTDTSMDELESQPLLLNDTSKLNRSSTRILKIAAFLAILGGVGGIIGYFVASEKDSGGSSSDRRDDNSMKLQLFERDTNMMCLDGEPSGFYYRIGEDQDTWVIFFEGGGICTGLDCEERIDGDLGTSKNWPEHRDFTNILDSDNPSNPFANCSHVFIPYCSGDGHSGTLTEPGEYGFYHTGYYTMNATVTWLIENTNISSAENVLVTGESAGGIGAFMNADYIYDALPSVDVKASPLGGYYFPARLSSAPEYASGIVNGTVDREQARNYSATFRSNLLPACVEKEEDPGDCATVGIMHPYMKTPLLIAQNIYDNEQTGRLGMDFLPPELQGSYQNFFGEKMVTTIMDNIETSANREDSGYFLPACTEHTEQLGVQSGVALPNGEDIEVNYAKVLHSWFYDTNNVSSRVIDPCWLPTSGPCTRNCKGADKY